MSFRFPQTIKRSAPGTYVNGVFVNGATTEISIQASIQPVTGEDMKTLPEGRRLSDYVKVYTDTLIQNVADGQQPDRILWRGHEYEALSMDVRQMAVINHYKVIFSRV